MKVLRLRGHSKAGSFVRKGKREDIRIEIYSAAERLSMLKYSSGLPAVDVDITLKIDSVSKAKS